MCVINPASSSHAIWLLRSPSSQTFPLLHSLCTRRALHSPRGISCVSTLPYKWRHWLWGLFDTHSHTVQTQLIFSGALRDGGRRGGVLKKDLHTYNRSQAFLWNKNGVCKKEQNAPLIRMWQGAIFPWSQLLSTEHYQQSRKGSERHSKNVILSYLLSLTSGIMQLAVLIIHFFFFFAWADFPLRDAKIMTPSFDNICSSIKKCLCQSSPVWALPVHRVHGSRGIY